MIRKSLLSIVFLLVGAIHVYAQIWIDVANGTQYYKTQTVDQGLTPQKGDIIYMKLKKYSPEGLLVFSTDMIDEKNGVEMTLHSDVVDGDILDVFLNLKPGEKAKAKVPVWVADKLISSTEKDTFFYAYEIELIHFKTKDQLEQERHQLLEKLKVEQKLLFEEIASQKYPRHHIVSKKEGLYILKEEKCKVKKSQLIRSKTEVTTHYKLQLLPEMIQLDNSYLRGEPFTFKVDDGVVIKGWDVAFMQLKKGDKAVLLIPSWLAYGFTGSGRDIAPNTPLLFEVEILK